MANRWYALSIAPLAAAAIGPASPVPSLAIGAVIAAIGVAVQVNEGRERASQRATIDPHRG